MRLFGYARDSASQQALGSQVHVLQSGRRETAPNLYQPGQRHCKSVRMNRQIEQFERGILPYFFNTRGRLCPKRLSTMTMMTIAWFGTLHYCFGDQPWQGMPGIILSLIIAGCLVEIKFVIEQLGHKPTWGGLDPLGWAADYNGHPSTHRVKALVSTVLACIVIIENAFAGENMPGEMTVAIFLMIVPLALNNLCEFIEFRHKYKGR